MIRLQTVYPCERPGRLIAKLCKHFRHKVPAEWDEQSGRVDFQPGNCLMLAGEGALLLHIDAAGEGDAQRIQRVLEGHLRIMERLADLQLDWLPRESP